MEPNKTTPPGVWRVTRYRDGNVLESYTTIWSPMVPSIELQLSEGEHEVWDDGAGNRLELRPAALVKALHP